MNHDEMNKEKTPETPEVAEAPAPETFQERVPSKKRTALLRYMTVMFAAAFLLVLMSFVFQMKSHNTTISQMTQTSASALSRAEQLQEDNRELQRELSIAREYVELAREEGEGDVENTKAAYDALLTVLSTEEPKDGDVEYSKAVETVKNLQEYLSDETVALFEEVMAQRAEEE